MAVIPETNGMSEAAFRQAMAEIAKGHDILLGDERSQKQEIEDAYAEGFLAAEKKFPPRAHIFSATFCKYLGKENEHNYEHVQRIKRSFMEGHASSGNW